uniref:Nudix hydrolase domain-containing protein n=1 Tax=Acrobeloides nanus TaxID=290746 RepID=A0A914CMX2_9BILA
MLQILLVHMGGPFWAKKDAGAWTIPKGEFNPDQDPLLTALREFEEETGTKLSTEGKNLIQLTTIKQKGGKIVHSWAVEGNLDAANIKSNTFEMEWPPKSGKKQEFPEVDKAGWFGIEEAKKKMLASQIPIVEELVRKLEIGDAKKDSGVDSKKRLAQQEEHIVEKKKRKG